MATAKSKLKQSDSSKRNYELQSKMPKMQVKKPPVPKKAKK